MKLAGDALLVAPTTSALWAAALGDRVALGAGEEPFSVGLLRDGRERLPYSVLRLMRCAWRGRSGAEAAGMVPAVDAAGGTLRWSHASGEPPSGVAYTLEGLRRPECVVAQELTPLVRGLGSRHESRAGLWPIREKKRLDSMAWLKQPSTS